MEKLTVNVQVKFKAPMAKVWQGLTDPAMVKKYFFGTDLESSWRVGEPIKFSGEWDGKKYEDHGLSLLMNSLQKAYLRQVFHLK